MIEISSPILKAFILDPVKDNARFGTRFVTGGYIFQIERMSDRTPLMTGPTYPEEFHLFHGQGLPDTFHRAPIAAKGKETVLTLGIGEIDLETDTIVRPLIWDVKKSGSSAAFIARHTFGDIDMVMEKTVTVDGSTIKTGYTLRNGSNTCIPVSWYPHPFFPPKAIGETMFSVPEDSYFVNDQGYFSISNGKIKRVPGVDQELSFQPMTIPGTEYTEVTIETGLGYDCQMKTDFSSHFVPVWANDKTCSAEPYLDDMLFPYCTLSWSVSYRFIFK